MKTIINISCLVVLMISFSACEKVIDISVRDSETKYVIEGVITNEQGSCHVYLSRTQTYNADNNFEQVGGAIVTIKDNGKETVLTENRPGEYGAAHLTGVPGHRYDLSVNINNQVFSATSTMPQSARLDTLYIAPGPFGQFQFATVAYTDSVGAGNKYRFVQYLNGTKDPEIFWASDEFTDGQKVVVQLDTGVDKKDDPLNIKSGDEVTIEMLALDNNIFNYWYSLQTGGGNGGGNSAAPSNPTSNIIGGALGYFSAHTVDRRTVIAP
jgi:hypothetical protein